MKVSLVVTTPDIENAIVEIARVSSSRENKTENPIGLINYLIRNSHWSPFEHGHITMEIITSKAIGIQLIRHRSFTFQEFSQRYQDVQRVDEDMFEDIELRLQAKDNRQSSTEIVVRSDLYNDISNHLDDCRKLYKKLLESGVAREQARMILPMTTKTRIFMTGSIRSWVHFIGLRDDPHAQKEIRWVAKKIKGILVNELPIISSALGWST